jgi:hypothetical protein
MLEEKLDFKVTYKMTGQGMAKYKHDPHAASLQNG